MKHQHHIIPKHMGGTNEPTNLYECSVEEHAELHLALYLEHGYREDWLAFNGLSGQIQTQDIQIERSRIGAYNSQIGRTHESRSKAASKGNTPEVRARKSATMMGRGTPHTQESKERIRQATLKSQQQMRDEGKHIGRVARPVVMDGVLYHNIQEMSNTLNIHLQSAYRMIYTGRAHYQ